MATPQTHHHQILLDQLTLSERGEGVDYASHIYTCPPPPQIFKPSAISGKAIGATVIQDGDYTAEILI